MVFADSFGDFGRLAGPQDMGLALADDPAENAGLVCLLLCHGSPGKLRPLLYWLDARHFGRGVGRATLYHGGRPGLGVNVAVGSDLYPQNAAQAEAQLAQAAQSCLSGRDARLFASAVAGSLRFGRADSL